LNEEIFQISELFDRLEKRAKMTIMVSDSIQKKEICDRVVLKFPRQPSEINARFHPFLLEIKYWIESN
jgi:hypothetical protein